MLIVLLASAAVSWGAERTKPNILFILCDDLGINDLHCYGRQDHNTPNLDRLATQGTRFTSAHCAQPICSPSRAAILTGKVPARLHLTTFLPGRPNAASQKLLHPEIQMQVPLEEKMIPEYLKAAGYVSGAFGKWHVGGKGFEPQDQGFDLCHPGRPNTTPSETEGGKGEYDLTSQAVKFIEANRDRPFFLYLAHNSPHIPYSARTNWVAGNARAFEPVYAALIETLDETAGRLMARLDALGLATNTIVVFTSDNGGLHVPEGGHAKITHNTPFRAGKGFLYEGGLRIPLLVRWPGRVPAGRVVDDPVVNTDWLPTLLELAGLPVPNALDGVSFAGLLTKPGGWKPRRLFWHFPHYTNQGSRPAGAVRDGDWKLIEHYEDGRVELFNLARDVAETQDLSDQEPRQVATLRAALAAWRQSVGAQTNPLNLDFQADLHHPLYVDFDVSRFDPPKASALDWERIQTWRKGMNAVLSTTQTPKR